MGETEQITVAEGSDGFGGSDEMGPVSLPVVELLTGRGFVTGKSGSGKSNSASVIAEKLLDNGFGLLIVDIDGEYYGLKEEYEILHVGADEECDIQITSDHSEKLASLALEQNVPIILDVSSYLDEGEAEEVLTAVARSLFAKAKKQKQPFLLLVEEVHEYIPENGSVGECGKMLIKIGKRGRKHGLGICGISQRPADVKKDFITQCDWLLWHRLTWNNDTKVVRRILDGDYAEAVENLDDGEGFLMTDWSETVRRVQFYRKQTFDAGATPGLDDFERPDLKSVSDDLVSELESISDEKQARDDRIAELRDELDRKNSRIAELEKELQDARDMSRMADQFVDALVRHVEGSAPGRTERERMRGTNSPAAGGPVDEPIPDPPEVETTPDESDGNIPDQHEATESDESADDDGADEAFGEMMDAAAADAGMFDDASEESDGDEQSFGEEDAFDDGGAFAENEPSGGGASEPQTAFDGTSVDGVAVSEEDHSTVDTTTGNGVREEASSGAGFSAEAILDALDAASEMPLNDVVDEEVSRNDQTAREEVEASLRDDAEFVDDEPEAEEESASSDEHDIVVRELKADIGGMETKTRKMLDFYREFGPSSPLNAHFGAGGDGDRTKAYAHNRELRTRGLIEHVGRGHYDYRLRDLLEEELDNSVDQYTVESYAAEIEDTVFS